MNASGASRDNGPTSACSTSSGPPSPRPAIPASLPGNAGGGGGAGKDIKLKVRRPVREGGGEQSEPSKPHHRGPGAVKPAGRGAHARISGQRRTAAARNPRLGGHFPPPGLLFSRKARARTPPAAGTQSGLRQRPGKAA